MRRPLNRRMIMNTLNLRGTISSLIASISSLVSNAMMVFVYMMFIFIEQKYMAVKIQKFASDKNNGDKIWNIIKKIDSNMKTYITVKTAISISTAVVSYLIMISVGLQYATFWAMILFIMNYIPTFGSIVSCLLPMAFALIQFDNAWPIAIVWVGLIFSQLLFGNYLEPKILGRTLNLSPLVIIISLVVWGMIWGVVGMFLCVPIMSLVMVALSAIPSTKKIAVLLSEDGEIVR
jgi:predicted PurR-regulated permease PerM